MNKKAVLLINLGTPDHVDTRSVRRYLRDFLNDPRVIDLPAFVRWPLVNLLIVPFRYKKTTAAYQQIWDGQGSPLLTISRRLQSGLSKALGSGYQVELGMRYGSPSIQLAMNQLKTCDSLTVIPLFPQYSSAATGSAIESLFNSAAGQWNIPEIKIISDFFSQPDFISAVADGISRTLNGKTIDRILFSYHGLPERHVIKSGCASSCDRLNACPPVDSDNRYCYRAQCYATTEAVAHQLRLPRQQYSVAFQSRLGKTPWIKPYTDKVFPELIEKGIRNLAVVSPSFVADCLETLEEINIRGRAQWLALGGKEFTFIPCINDSQIWINALKKMILSA
ncbi:Ferrochelatase [Aquicella siphonis]|uniref:Ferrochelatase n=1 Tax=Aquicella siphonis TaxID=254247 RepID=A0A5E4PHB9_9COXI|nr:ferrochelatase [Aquicella siphonis]VVC75908.1 Ferrochelatase [Aquicella siphonis]